MDPDSLGQLLHKRIDLESRVKVIAKGLPASPGAASGKIVLCADQAENWLIKVKR